MHTPLRLLVIGAGAMGGVYAAYASRQADVTVLDNNREHIEAIRARGLRLSGVADMTAKLAAFETPARMGKQAFDAVLFLVKSQVTAAALESVLPWLEGTPVLVSLQNGMGNTELLEAGSRLPVGHGVTLEAGRYLGPGRIEHFIHGEEACMGPARGDIEPMRRLGAVLTETGLPTRVVADPRGAIWAKFLFNCVMNPLGALVRGNNRARYLVPEMRDLIDAMFA